MNKFYLNGEIEENSVQPLLEFLKNNEDTPVTIHIDSIGGDVFAGLQICRAIANHQAEVTAECGIIVASIASVIALSCHKITITKDTFMMIHKPWTVVCGTAEDLLSTAALLEQSGKRIQEICNDKVNEGIDTSSWFISDTWFGYEEILNSFKDVVINEEPEINTKVLSLTAKLKTAPDALVAIAAKLQEEAIPVNEDDDTEITTEEDTVDEVDPDVPSEEVVEMTEEEEEKHEIDKTFALSVMNRLSKLNIC